MMGGPIGNFFPPGYSGKWKLESTRPARAGMCVRGWRGALGAVDRAPLAAAADAAHISHTTQSIAVDMLSNRNRMDPAFTGTKDVD